MRRKRQTAARAAGWQTLARDAALVVLVAASDSIFGHAGAAFAAVVALGAILGGGHQQSGGR